MLNHEPKPNNSFNRSGISPDVIVNLSHDVAVSRPVNSGVRLLLNGRKTSMNSWIWFLALLIPLTPIAIIVYLVYRPAHADRRRLWRYDALVFVLGLFLCFVQAYWIRSQMLLDIEGRLWWPVVVVLYSFPVFLITLLICGLARNLWFFRSR